MEVDDTLEIDASTELSLVSKALDFPFGRPCSARPVLRLVDLVTEAVTSTVLDLPITDDVTETLPRSRPPSVDEVKRLLEEAEDPFEVDERLEELAEELQAEYPDHEISLAVVDAVERDTPPSDERTGELIEETERLLEGVDEQLQRIQETMDDLEDGSVVLLE